MARGKVQPAAAEPIDGPWVLPGGWRWERLGDYVSRAGTSVTPARSPDKEFQLYSVPSFPSGRPEIVKGATVGSSKQVVQPNDVLLCKINPRINRVWKVTDFSGGTLIASTEWIRFSASDQLHPDYLRYFLMRDQVREYLSMNVSGVGGSLMRVRPSTVDPVPIPWAPVKAQLRIVERIDELFAEIDDGEAALERARGDLATWRKALLKAAVTGELTAEWRAANPPTETGADLLARILSEPTAACDAGHLTVGLPPDGWTSVQLGQIASLQGGFAFKSEHYTSDGIFLIRIGDIRRGDIVPTSSSARLPVKAASSANSFRVHHNDLLIAMSGATTAKFGRYRSNEPALLNQRVGRFRVNEAYLNSNFLAFWLGLWQASILEAAYGGAQPNISSRQIEAMTILLPPILEQDELVSRLVEPLMIADEYDDTLINSQLEATTLRQSILAAAFRGELVA